MLHAADYQPPRWLRNPHLQSILSSSALRKQRGLEALKKINAQFEEHLIDTEHARLQGFLWQLSDQSHSRGLVVLLHGWEGSHESSYMRHSTARLLEKGFQVFTLNFRDHGNTHHLNEELFHSCRIDEVLAGVSAVYKRFSPVQLFAAGYSLGGNFALRLALAATQVGLPLQHAVAVCPVLHGATGLVAIETGMPLYHWYFMRKWRHSLRRKRQLFPHRHNFDEHILSRNMRELTRWLVENHTRFGSLEAYLEGYAVAGDRLAGLQVPVSILTAADDPVIPVADFHQLQLPSHSQLQIAGWGGHCAFIEGADMRGFSEYWVADQIDAAASSNPG